jgi:Flp pilus assembly protein TadD
MSVINDMLSQLDQRRAQPVKVGDTMVSAAPSSPQVGVRWKWLGLLSVGAAAVSAAAWADWPALMHTPPAHSPQAVRMGPDAAPAIVPLSAEQQTPPNPSGSAVGMEVPATAQATLASEAVTTAIHTLQARLATDSTTPKPATPSPVNSAVGTTTGFTRGDMQLAYAKPQAQPKPSSVATFTPTQTPQPAASAATTPTLNETFSATTQSAVGTPRIDKKMAPLSPMQRAEQQYLQASELAASGHSSQAIERALDALKTDNTHDHARQLAAVLMVEKGRFDEAAKLLSEGLQKQPQQAQWTYLLARIKTETGDVAGALALLQHTDMLTAEGFSLRAALLVQQGQYGAALPSYEAALRRNPDNAIVWLGLAVALDAQSNTSQAQLAYARAKSVGELRGGLSPELQTYIEQKLATRR